MDLRKVTCSECKSHLHYMENMSVKKNGVTMHFGDRFCMGGKKPRKFGRGDPKIYVPTGGLGQRLLPFLDPNTRERKRL